jgi:hypothetical protein
MAPNSTALASQTSQPQIPPLPQNQPTPAPQSQTPPADGQETIQGMASRIRTKYPGAYDDKPDDELVHHWVAKYPVYSDKLAPAEKAKLPDVNKSLFDPANKGIDPETYSRIYSSYHPAEPAPAGFLDNVTGEAKHIWHGLTAEPEMVEGMDSMLAKGQSAQDAVSSFKAGNYGDAASHAAGVIPVIGSTIEARSQQAKTDPWGAVGAGLTDTAAAAAPFLIDRMLEPGEGPGTRPGIRQKGAEALAKTTVPRTMTEAKADLKYGHSAERAIVGEGVTNSKQAAAKMEDVGQALDRALTQPKYMGKTVEVEPIIRERADAHIQDAKRAGNPGAVKRIEDVRDAMLNEYGNLDKSPRAAAAMKTQLYGDVKFTGNDYDTEANAFRKDVASGIRDRINDVTGKEIPELNQRYGDLAAARDSMQRGELSRAQKGIKERAITGTMAQGTRKIAQWLSDKYEDPTKIAPTIPAGITRQAPEAAPEPAGGPALPAAAMPSGKPQLKPAPLVTPPPGPGVEELQGQLNSLLDQIIKDGPREDVIARAREVDAKLKEAQQSAERGGGKPGGEGITVQAGGKSYQFKDQASADAFKKEAGIEATPANGTKKTASSSPDLSRGDQEKADRVEMGQLEARINRYIDQRGGARSPERFGELSQKLKDAKARYNELAAKHPKPEVEAPAEDERPKSIWSGKETAQSTGQKTEPKVSRSPAFDSMPKEHQEWMARWAQEIRHLPQSLREGEMKELDSYGQPYDLLKEKIAKRHLAQRDQGQAANP